MDSTEFRLQGPDRYVRLADLLSLIPDNDRVWSVLEVDGIWSVPAGDGASGLPGDLSAQPGAAGRYDIVAAVRRGTAVRRRSAGRPCARRTSSGGVRTGGTTGAGDQGVRLGAGLAPAQGV